MSYTLVLKTQQLKKMKKFYLLSLSIFCILSCEQKKNANETVYESASYQRFKNGKVRYERFNEFITKFKFEEVSGIGYEKGVSRRDPSSVIKVDNLYYVWYTKPSQSPRVGYSKANDTLRAYHWDLAEIWYSTSPDGYKWTEQGVAIKRGPKGAFDHRSVYTADVLVANGKYYMFYQAAGSLAQGHDYPHNKMGGDFIDNHIGMSWADSPNGPWHRVKTPVLSVGKENEWDSNVVHDPSLIVRNGKYWLYYKSSPRAPWQAWGDKGYANKYADIHKAAIGVAVADKPEGPYVKSKYNPVILGGHEVIVWPYRKGVCAFLSEGPEARSIQYSTDGINFYPVAHGIQKPEAAGVFRASNFIDTDIQDGKGITWGLHHVLNKDNYLRRFEGNLSLEKGNKIKAEYDKVKHFMNGGQYDKNSY